MDNPGDYPLYVGTITTALDRSTGAQAWSEVDFSGMTALTLSARFAYGSGGATCSAIVQAGSSVDAALVRDIARFDFLVATRVARANLEGLLSLGVVDYADLAAEGVNDGLLMDRLRVLLIVGSTPYVNTTLSIIAAAR